MIDELVVDYEEIDDTILNLINNNDISFNDVPIRSERSIWYELYSELISSQTRFDISRKTLLPRFNLSTVSFDEYKEELKKRYLFLAKNSLFLLAPLVRSEDELSYLVRSFDYKYNKNSKKDFNGKYDLHLVSDIYLSVLLEKLLLGDEKLEDNELYKKVMKLKENPKYLERVKEGLVLMQHGFLVEKIDNPDYGVFDLLKRVRCYIEGQEDCLNKKRKLCVLDEYFRILRYSNDGKEWTSGYALDYHDILTRFYEDKSFDSLPKYEVIPVKSKGIGYTNFIKAFNVKKDWLEGVYHSNELTEKERQEIYLKLHDELPWDLEIECKLEEPELRSMNDTRLVRPENTKPCGSKFRISEGVIFVTKRGYYHLCSECGYIVKVPPKYISEGIGKRIRERCSKDENLFRKMEIISELQALDDRSLPQHKVLFKEKK